MAACPSCGKDNAADAHFCSACGTALAAQAQREVRTARRLYARKESVFGVERTTARLRELEREPLAERD